LTILGTIDNIQYTGPTKDILVQKMNMRAFMFFMLLSAIQILESSSVSNKLHDLFSQVLQKIQLKEKNHDLMSCIPILQPTQVLNSNQTNI